MPKATLIPNGVDLALFDDASPVVFAGKNGNVKTTVIYIGSIENRKGLLVLAKAAALLAERKWIQYVIAGVVQKREESYAQEVMSFINENGLQRYFHFLGYREDIPNVLAGADILCHPAYIEAFGRVILEAMAAKLPVIGTRIGEMANIIEDGKTGFLVSPGDFTTLAHYIALSITTNLCV